MPLGVPRNRTPGRRNGDCRPPTPSDTDLPNRAKYVSSRQTGLRRFEWKTNRQCVAPAFTPRPQGRSEQDPAAADGAQTGTCLRYVRIASTAQRRRKPRSSQSTQRASMMPAAPCPVPTHIVTMPYFQLVPTQRVHHGGPLRGWHQWHPADAPAQSRHPSGSPSLGSSPSVLITASDCAANASFSSYQPMSSLLRPAYRSAAGIASMGPNAHDLGRHAARRSSQSGPGRQAKLLHGLFAGHDEGTRAIAGLRAVARRDAAACGKHGLELGQAFEDVSGRGPSSRFTVRRFPPLRRWRVGRALHDFDGRDFVGELTGLCALMARRWDSRRTHPISRLTFHCWATFSAVRPMP